MERGSSLFGFGSITTASMFTALGLMVLGGKTNPAPTPPPANDRAASAPAGAPAAAPVAGTANVKDAGRFDRGEMLLRAYFGRKLGAGPCKARCHELDVLVATLPDPYDSRLDWLYDGQMEALRRAYETAGFVIDRFWLPPNGDSAEVAQLGEVFPRRHLYPGVVLFRGAGAGERKLRLLYLVGETPTAGVHRVALENALAERDTLLRGRDVLVAGPRSDSVRIVGPTFSGSAGSLRRALEGRPGPFALVSGSATSPSNAAVVTDSGRLPAAFRTMVNTDDVLEGALDSLVLGPLGIARSEMAVLRESSTQYGVSVVRRGGDSSLVIPFPANISAVRREYERTPQAASAADPRLPVQPGTASRVALTLQDGPRPREGPPIVSPQITPAAAEVMMDEIVSTLRHHRVRLVGIQATDVRDKLFLAERLRKELRDVRLYTFESNALYLRGDRNAALRGMLVLSSYPLLLENQWWTAPGPARGRERALFPSDAAQGTYNAALLQLADAAPVLETDPPFTGGHDAGPPPVWLAAVGTRSFLPLACRDRGGACAATVPSAGAVAQRAAVPLSSPAAGVLLLLGAGVLATSVISLWGTAKRFRELGRLEIPRLPTAAVPGMEAETGSPAYAEAAPLAPSPVPALGVPPSARDSGRVAVAAAEASALAPGEEAVAVLLEPSPPPSGPWLHGRLVRLGSGFRVWSQQGTRRTGVRMRAAGGRIAAWVPGRVRAGWGRLAGRWRESVGADLGGGAGEVRSQVLCGSLLLHRELYTGLRLLAVGGLFAPVGVLLWQPDRPAWLSVAAPLLSVVWGLAVLAALGQALCTLDMFVRQGWHYLWRRGWTRDGELRGVLWAVEVFGRWLVLAMGGFYAVLAGLFLLDLRGMAAGTPRAAFFSHRAVQLGSGFSPLLPVLLAGVGLLLWSTWHLQRIGSLSETTGFELACLRRDGSGRAGTSRVEDRIARAVSEVRDRLFLLVPHPRAFLLLGVLGLTVAWLLPQFGRTLEAAALPLRGGLSSFDWLLRFSVASTLVATAWAVYRLVAVWSALQRCLYAVEESPLYEALGQLPPHVGRLTRLTLFGRSYTSAVDALVADRWNELAGIERAEGKAGPPLPAAEPGRGAGWRVKVWEREARQRAEDFHAVLARLCETWRAKPAAGEGDGEPGAASAPGAEARWRAAAESFVAVQFVEYVQGVLQQFRNLAVFLFLSLLLTTALVSSYPFGAQSVVKLVFLFVLLATVGSLLVVMTQMNADPVLSRIAKTDPGRVNWDGPFVLNGLLVAVVPLLALVSSEYPGLRTTLFAWVEPLVKAVSGG